jgi:hypothetical protein
MLVALQQAKYNHDTGKINNKAREEYPMRGVARNAS